jgi:SH3 domain
MTSQTWRVRACAAERPTNPDPLTMHSGERVQIAGREEDGWVWCRNGAGKEDWVPLSYLTGAGEGTTRTALAEYDSTVLSVEVGEEFQAVLEEHGWVWCENAQGKWGWVRLAHVERLAEA